MESFILEQVTVVQPLCLQANRLKSKQDFDFVNLNLHARAAQQMLTHNKLNVRRLDEIGVLFLMCRYFSLNVSL